MIASLHNKKLFFCPFKCWHNLCKTDF